MVSNKTAYYPETQRLPLLGRRIQVVGYAGAGKVSLSAIVTHTGSGTPFSNKITNISVYQSVFSEKLAAAIQVIN